PRVDFLVADPSAPAVLGALEARQRALRQRRSVARLPGLAQPGGDRVAGAVADLEQALPGSPAALRDAVPAVLASELHSELLEPVNRALGVAGQPLDETHVGGLVRALPDVLGVDLGGVVLAERGLDPALRLRRVARLERSLGRDGDACTRSVGRHAGGEA